MAKDKRILYMGDDSLTGAAGYLGAMLSRAGYSFEYRPSAEQAAIDGGRKGTDLFIISDYPHGNFRGEDIQALVEQVRSGASLWMIGGWESFYGLKGEYHQGPISEMLPVECKSSDDRVNYCQGAVVVRRREHPCLAGLPWDRPPVVCGYNEVKVRPGAECALVLRKLEIRGESVVMQAGEAPLLVFGKFGRGKTCALATDLAPHWVGGWVDWGTPRITAQAPGGGEVEVGIHYAGFISQLVGYLLEG